jgi:hypothetical protein
MSRRPLQTLKKNKSGSNQQLAAKNILNFNPWQTSYKTNFDKLAKE